MGLARAADHHTGRRLVERTERDVLPDTHLREQTETLAIFRDEADSKIPGLGRMTEADRFSVEP